MLGHTGFESLADINCRSPGMFHPDRVKGPGVKRLGNIPSKKKRGLAEEHEAAELATSEGAHLKLTGNHVTGKGVAGSVYPAELSCVRGANVWVNFVVRRSNVELSVSPKHVRRKKHSFVLRRIDLCPRPGRQPSDNKQKVKGFHLASNASEKLNGANWEWIWSRVQSPHCTSLGFWGFSRRLYEKP